MQKQHYYLAGIEQEDFTLGDAMRIKASTEKEAAVKYEKLFGRLPTYIESVSKKYRKEL